MLSIKWIISGCPGRISTTVFVKIKKQFQTKTISVYCRWQDINPYMYQWPLNMYQSKLNMSCLRGCAFKQVQGPMIHMRILLSPDQQCYIALPRQPGSVVVQQHCFGAGKTMYVSLALENVQSKIDTSYIRGFVFTHIQGPIIHRIFSPGQQCYCATSVQK